MTSQAMKTPGFYPTPPLVIRAISGMQFFVCPADRYWQCISPNPPYDDTKPAEKGEPGGRNNQAQRDGGEEHETTR